ncbi:MAG: hypothetical protein D6705_13570 [Deltaproteobacteria bacterium]|nr:MAG: hypothetical protein D6705_13570 [Deltaproteobacteria bacterium]
MPASGARGEVAELATHDCRPQPSAFDAYATFEWATRCRERSRLRVRDPLGGSSRSARDVDEARSVSPTSPGGRRRGYVAVEIVLRRNRVPSHRGTMFPASW